MQETRWRLWPALVRSVQAPARMLEEARGTLFPWVAVAIATGVAIWFGLAREPTVATYILVAASGGSFFVAALGRPALGQPVLWFGFCVALGFLAAGLRGAMVAAPVLDEPYYGPVAGRVIALDRSQSDAIRLTLDHVQLDGIAPNKTPERVRISLRGKIAGHSPLPGEVVMTTATLSAPEGPTEPDAFDFRRLAYFDRLGAVGYTNAPLVLWQGAGPWSRPIDRLRLYLSDAMRARMEGQAGAFAAGAMTGDRSGITSDTTEDLRDSSLAHLLAISGMNLAFLIAFLFGLIRYGLALIPRLALRVNTKKVAAAVSLLVAAFYLGLSGANVATERAFIMVAVVLGAVLLDRRALTLRSVTIAGILILLRQPEALLEPGFQMSFAATVALIAGFRALERRVAGRWSSVWVQIVTLVLSSVLGGLATAPFAAAHFNRLSAYGLIANMLTVPVMGAVVMPAGAIAALLAPFGLADPALWMMERGSAWILWVAGWIAGWDAAVMAVPAPQPAVLPAIGLAAAWLVIWRGRGAAIWGAGFALALLLWWQSPRPDILISGDGDLVGVIAPEGRTLSAEKGAGFTARSWLENDGDLADQGQAAARSVTGQPTAVWSFDIGPLPAAVVKGKGGAEIAASLCQGVGVVVLGARWEGPAPEGDCLLLDQTALETTGTIALWHSADGWRIKATRGEKQRQWSAPSQGADAVLHSLRDRLGQVGQSRQVSNCGSIRQACPAP